ncbi:uncharacterized protein L3040_008274 [Drepanopeziza brunnea f. sp. 'multigermtubi']|uniref:ribonuclease H n=1 Tax=Marssonina brunnea f. sp. multigermtubi (strain MB_m1) TaxID=1072389 RepID=K1WAQ7_MARBU|nr:ribonuclease H1 [Drepanopeziza brunnea f. sp. 'multigermtubi' MB_m1]EKD14370.1 ribonuclease H1 [Drepanopeziza brunnea f. sp. 'multigermtubi' MB_m1]KAJ5035012.1 hypothetical protein L3040_008274 [Drepanopeziza brunnea f. sp. 'multigermtubi']
MARTVDSLGATVPDPYPMKIYIDGVCRGQVPGNGSPSTIGGAAAVLTYGFGNDSPEICDHFLRSSNYHGAPPVTRKRAVITAVIIALLKALQKHYELGTDPYLNVEIYTDSRYVISCMTDWQYLWRSQNWITTARREVANRDLIEAAVELNDRLMEKGRVGYIWIPQSQNQIAVRACIEVMDRNS